MIPFLRKQEIWCRGDNPSDKVCGQRGMLMSYPSQGLRYQDVARVSKSEKAIKPHYQRLKLLERGKLHEEQVHKV